MDASNDARERSKESAKRAKQMSPGIQYAICVAMPNIVNGCFWGFTNLKEVMKHEDVIKQEKAIIARKLKDNSCLIEVEPDFLLKAIMSIDPNALKQKDISIMQESRLTATMDLRKFLLISGIKKPNFGGTIGIYCINDTTTIRYRGVAYPAFRTNLLTTMKALSDCGYTVQVNGSFITPADACKVGQKFWETVELSPTKTGLFINIKCMKSQEEMKMIQKRMKEQNLI